MNIRRGQGAQNHDDELFAFNNVHQHEAVDNFLGQNMQTMSSDRKTGKFKTVKSSKSPVGRSTYESKKTPNFSK